MQNIYIVQALGWGDSEDEFYNVGTFSTEEKAKAYMQQLQNEWVADNGDLTGCELQIEQFPLDG